MDKNNENQTCWIPKFVLNHTCLELVNRKLQKQLSFFGRDESNQTTTEKLHAMHLQNKRLDWTQSNFGMKI